MKKNIPFLQKGILSTVLILLFVNVNTIAQPNIAEEPILRLNAEMHLARIDRIDTDAEGKYILTGSHDKTAKLWNASSGELIRTFRIPIGKGNDGMVYAVALSPDGSVLSVATRDGGVYIFDTHTGEMTHHMNHFIGGLSWGNSVFDLEFSFDGAYLGVALGNEGVKIYNTQSWQEKATLSHGGKVNNIAFDKSGRLATISYDGIIRLFDNSFELVIMKSTSEGNPFSLAFSPDGTKLAVGHSNSPVIYVLDGQELSLLYEPDIRAKKQGGRRLNKVGFSSDGQYLYAGGTYFSTSLYNRYGLVRYVIRRWEKEGRGSYVEIPVGHSNIMDIKALPKGSMVYATAAPDFGRINWKGDIVFSKTSDKNNYSLKDRSHLRINHSGDEIGFNPSYEKDPLTFSFLERLLIKKESNHPSYVDKAGKIKVKDWLNSTAPRLNRKKINFLRGHDRSRSVDVDKSNNVTVIGSEYKIVSYDANRKMRWITSAQSPAFAVNISGNGQVIAAAHADGVIRWYRMRDGELLLSLFAHPDNKKWLLWTPMGYYDASDGAEELIGWHINNGSNQEAKFFPIDRFFETYYRPDIIDEVLRTYETGKQIADRLGGNIASQFKKPPSVRFTSPTVGQKASTKSVILTAEITDQGGGIDEVRLFHNGKLIEGGTRGLKLSSGSGFITREFEVNLLPGENKFELTAFSTGQRIESNPAKLSVKYEGTVATSDLYVLAVGLNEYKNSSLNLNYGRPDAEAFVNSVKKRSAGIFKSVNVTTLYDGQATRSGIKTAFEDIISSAKPQDTFLLFYAGHGVMSEPEGRQQGDFYMALHDATQLYGNNAGLKAHGISAAEMTELTRRIAARKQMIVLDACQSGGAVETFAMRGAAEQKAIIQLARSAGLVVMASTGTEQYATEFSALGHGVFTYALLNGLEGQADGGGRDGKITVKELEAFINDQVPELTQKHRGQSQYPNSYARGQDFPIGVIKN